MKIIQERTWVLCPQCRSLEPAVDDCPVCGGAGIVVKEDDR